MLPQEFAEFRKIPHGINDFSIAAQKCHAKKLTFVDLDFHACNSCVLREKTNRQSCRKH